MYEGIPDMPTGPSAIDKPSTGQLALIDPADWGRKPDRDQSWKDALWAQEGHLAMQCVDAIQAHVDSFRLNLAPPISEPKIAALVGQNHRLVRRRLMAAKRRKIAPGLTSDKNGCWSLPQTGQL